MCEVKTKVGNQRNGIKESSLTSSLLQEGQDLYSLQGEQADPGLPELLCREGVWHKGGACHHVCQCQPIPCCLR